MGKKVCIFGQLFREVRKNCGLSQWDISVRAATHLSNVHQVEAGHQEPRILVAMRLVAACDADLNSFFTKLAEQINFGTIASQINSLTSQKLEEEVFYFPPPSFKLSGYGDLLRYCRSQKGLSQKNIAEKINYDLRSLQRVEKGEQEPMVTTAVKLVTAAGIPPGAFFTRLWFFLSQVG